MSGKTQSIRRSAALAALTAGLLFEGCRGEDPLRVVIIGSLDLNNSSNKLGADLKEGIYAAFQRANVTGVHGRQLGIEIWDDDYTASIAQKDFNALTGCDCNVVGDAKLDMLATVTINDCSDEEVPFAFVGNPGTPTNQVVASCIVAAANLDPPHVFPLIGPFTGADMLRQDSPEHIWNYRASYFDEVDELVNTFWVDGVARPAFGLLAQGTSTVECAGETSDACSCDDASFGMDSYGYSGYAGLVETLGGESFHCMTYAKESANDTYDNIESVYQWVTTDDPESSVFAVVLVGTAKAEVAFIQGLADAMKVASDEECADCTSPECADLLASASPPMDNGVCQRFQEIIFKLGTVSFAGTEELLEELTSNGKALCPTSEVGPDSAADATPYELFMSQVVPDPSGETPIANEYRAFLAEGLFPGYVGLEGYLAARLFLKGLNEAGRNPTARDLDEAFKAMGKFDLGTGADLELGPHDNQASDAVWMTELLMDGSSCVAKQFIPGGSTL